MAEIVEQIGPATRLQGIRRLEPERDDRRPPDHRRHRTGPGQRSGTGIAGHFARQPGGDRAASEEREQDHHQDAGRHGDEAQLIGCAELQGGNPWPSRRRLVD
jgi:hypothetical protein